MGSYHGICISPYYAGMDVSPNSGSLSGGTVLSLYHSDVYEMNSVDPSSVAVDIGGIPCDVLSGYAMHALVACIMHPVFNY